jgi:hypothetical protein
MVGSLTKKKVTELLLDPTWTKAVIFREPAERLLSAFLDKVAGKMKDPAASFPEWGHNITTISKNKEWPALGGHTDPHWKPQVMTCGLDFLLPHIDFVGNMEHLGEHTKLLLEKVGLWEEYGSKFDDGRGLKNRGGSCYANPPDRSSEVNATTI